MTNIFIAGHYNLNNGDRAVLEATVRQLLELYPHAKITVSAVEPNLLHDERYKTVGWPLEGKLTIAKLVRRLLEFGIVPFKKSVWKHLLNQDYLQGLVSADVVLVSGGHHLTDLLGDPTFFNLALNYLIPIVYEKNIVLLPQTIGPFCFSNKAKKKVMSTILEKAKKGYVRDQDSLSFIKKYYPLANFSYAPDVVQGMRLKKHSYRKQRSAAVALYCNYATESGQKIMMSVIKSLAKACSALANDGMLISIIPMETQGSSADDRTMARRLITEFESLDSSNKGKMRIEEPDDESSIESTVRMFESREVVFACKTHSVVFSMISASPLVAIAYHNKSIDFMRDAGLGEFAIFDKDVNEVILVDLAKKAMSEKDKIKKKELHHMSNCSDSLTKIFRELGEGY